VNSDERSEKSFCSTRRRRPELETTESDYIRRTNYVSSADSLSTMGQSTQIGHIIGRERTAPLGTPEGEMEKH